MSNPKNSEHEGSSQASNELRHPYHGKDTTFEEYLPFVHVTDDATKQRFVGILQELYASTGHEWGPTWCYSTEYLDRTIKKLKAQGKFQDVEFTAMNYISAHYFLKAKLDGISEELIIDPFGVDTPGKDYMHDRGTVIPFFGELQFASLRHQKVYSEAKPEDRAFWHFHP